MNVLVVNAGSSSLKYQLLDTSNRVIVAKGMCERIGMTGSLIEHRTGDEGQKTTRPVDIQNHADAIKLVIATLLDTQIGCISDISEIEAIGHRVVHGGPYFTQSSLATDEVIEKLKLCIDFAPLHTPGHLMGIEGCLESMPDIPQVLVFDTAFHTTIPEVAARYPISYEMAEKYKILRYGFHGTSHRYVTQEMIKLLDKPKSETKIITCHMGNGSSISAVSGGRCIDTSMGFTPLDGVMMGTRCGAIDPAIVTFIMKAEGLDPDSMRDYMNNECGFLGVSGISSDSRDIEAAILKGDKRAWVTANMLAYQVKKYIGMYAAAMNGLDAIVFTAGMGENNPELRERACSEMDYLGIKLDKRVNAAAHHQPNIVKLSSDDSKVLVYLIPTNEELMIALDTEELAKK